MLLSPHSLPSSTHSSHSSPRNLALDLITALLAIARLPGTVLAAATNTTFDDTQSSFSWSGSWNAITPAAPCPGCYSQPDPSQIHNGTWHDGHASGMDSPTFGSFTFTGSAVYIFGIDQTGVEADIVFELILGSSGRNITSTHHYTGSPLGGEFVYSTPYFSATDLPEDTYTVNWILNLDPASDTQIQVALIDYAVVTTGDSMASRVTGGPSIKPPLPTLNASHSSSHISGAGSSSSLIATSSTTIDVNTPETTILSTANSPSTSAASGPRQPTAARLHLGTIIGVSLGSSALVIAVLVVWRYLRKQRSHRFHRVADFSQPASSQRQQLLVYPLSVTAGRRGLVPNRKVALAADHARTAPSTVRGETDSARLNTPTAPVRRLAERLAELEARIEMVDMRPPPPYGQSRSDPAET